MTSLAEVNGALLLNRDTFVLRSRDRQMMLFDQFQAQPPQAAASGQPPKVQSAPGPGQDVLRPFVGPFLKLSRQEAERLTLLLGDALYERRGVTVPLGVLQLILSWLLISGALAVLRRQTWGLTTWSFACWASIFFALLCMLVTFVHSRTLMGKMGQTVATALSAANGQSIEAALSELWQITRLYVVMRAALEGVWVLLLGLTALYLQRYVHMYAPAQGPGSDRERPAR